jgi:hypothetical protein
MRARPKLAAFAASAGIVASLAVGAPAPAHGAPRSGLRVGVGDTFAVLGDPGRGGFSTTLAALWPVEERFAFGVMGFADDLGADLAPLADPSAPSTSLGRTESSHRSSWGGGWRMDAELKRLRAWTALASGTWGYYRIIDDHRGRGFRATNSTGWSLAAGARRGLLGRGTITPMIRYHRLFNDRAGRFVSAGVEFGW